MFNFFRKKYIYFIYFFFKWDFIINYVWNIKGIAKTVSEILNYIMKERNFTKQQMLDYLKNIPPYNNAMLFKNIEKIISKIKKAIR